MNKQTIKLVFAATALLVALQITGVAQSEQDFPEREETRRSFRLSPGALVEVTMIYGPVDIETSDTETAEILIVRSARRRDDFDSRPINIEQSASGLTIRGVRDSSQEPAKVRHRVLLKLPRRIELAVQKVNARVNIGETEGGLRLSGINGAVKVGHAVNYVDASDVNGSLTITLSKLGSRGIRAEDINGAVELYFTDELRANLSVIECNGAVSSNLPNTNIIEKKPKEIFVARIGGGGVPISITDVNGRVLLSHAN